LAAEEVEFPTSVFGLIVPRESKLQKHGLEIPPTKVDPGYAGHLCVTIFNHGYKPIQLDYGEQFCALVLFQVSPKAYPRTQPSALLQGKDVGVSTGRRISTFFRAQWQWLITSAIAITAIVVAFVR
jgi:deoxycytidine triphosphate deaminase